MGEYFQDGSWIGSPTDGGSSEGGSVGQVSGLVPSEEPSLRISQLVRDGAILKTVGRLLQPPNLGKIMSNPGFKVVLQGVIG